MKTVLLALCLCCLALCFASAAAADSPQITTIPEGLTPATPTEPSGACDILLRYDDGSDDYPGSGYTLGGPISPYQYLGIIATVPGDQSYRVQGAGFFSEFWVTPGVVHVTVTEVGNPANTASVPITVNVGGTWEVSYSPGICIPSGGSFSIMLCPDPGVWGVTGEDTALPDNRSHWATSDNGCIPVNSLVEDLMIWGCVTPCGGTATESSTWGAVKGLYR